MKRVQLLFPGEKIRVVMHSENIPGAEDQVVFDFLILYNNHFCCLAKLQL